MTQNRRPLTSRDTRWAQALARRLVAARVSPNAISVAGMVFATLGAAAFGALPWLGCAGLFPILAALGAVAGIQLRLLCNLMDGLVAVEGGLKARGGDLYNEAPDRYEDVLLLAAAGYAAGHAELGWMAGAAAVLTAYVRAFGASLGRGQDFCGPLAKPQRMFWLTVGTLASIFYAPALTAALWLIALGAFLTALRRILRLYAKL